MYTDLADGSVNSRSRLPAPRKARNDLPALRQRVAPAIDGTGPATLRAIVVPRRYRIVGDDAAACRALFDAAIKHEARVYFAGVDNLLDGHELVRSVSIHLKAAGAEDHRGLALLAHDVCVAGTG